MLALAPFFYMVKEYGISFVETARQLGVSSSIFSKIVSKVKRQQVNIINCVSYIPRAIFRYVEKNDWFAKETTHDIPMI